jgi:hypothetical protein
MENTVDNYMPDHKLLDFIKDKHDLRTDGQLARFLSTSKPVISKLRHNRKKVSATFILLVHEKTDMSIKEIKSLI